MKFIIVILAPIYIAAYALIGLVYPYYSAWDSSMVYALDALIAGSHQLPDHFFHPNMIPLVINGYILLPLGKLLGYISIDSIDNLKLIPNPYLSFVEVTKFLISMGYLFAYLFITSMYLSFKGLLDPYTSGLSKKWIFISQLMIALLSFSWGSLPNMLIWIRYETYGIVFWALSLLVMISATKSNRPIALFFLSGLLAGCAIFSKIQLIGSVVCLPFLYYAITKNPIEISKKSFTKIVIPIAAFLAIGISVLHAKTYYDFLNNRIIDVAFLNHLNSNNFIPVGPILAIVLLVISIFIGYRYKEVPKLISSNILLITIFTLGIFLVIFVSLVLGSTLHEKKSAIEATYIFSLMFGQLALKYLGNKVGSFEVTPPLILVFFLFSILLIGIFRSIKSQYFHKVNLREYLFSTLSIFILLIACNIFLRNDEPKKDTTLLHAWIMLAAILLLRLFFITIVNKKITWCLSIAISLSITFIQLKELKNYHKNYFTNNEYYYLKAQWKNFTYGYRQNQYTALMARAYPLEKSWNSVFLMSKNIDDIKLLLVQIFRNREIQLKDTALGEEESFLSLALQEKIKDLSPELRSSIVVPSLKGEVIIASRADYKTFLLTTSEEIQIEGSYRLTNLTFLTNLDSALIKYYVYEIKMPGVKILDNSNYFHIALKPDEYLNVSK
jgi:ABC-2 type transport system permease protein